MAFNAKDYGLTEAQLLKLVERNRDQKDKERRYWAEQKIILKKAKAKGITATDAEIETELKTMKRKNAK